ncbi:hypothetical protein [Halalkalibaculum sp. DA384]
MNEELKMMNFEGEIVLTCQAIIPKPEEVLSDEGASYKIYNLVFPGLEWGAEAEAGVCGCCTGEDFDSGQPA